MINLDKRKASSYNFENKPSAPKGKVSERGPYSSNIIYNKKDKLFIEDNIIMEFNQDIINQGAN